MFIDNKLYHLKPADSPATRFSGHPKTQELGVSIHPTASCRGSPLYNLKKYIANILKAYVELYHIFHQKCSH